jgi:hypothetical protein
LHPPPLPAAARREPDDGSRGAVYVELLVAVVPMFTLFWALLQLNGLFLADVLTQHAAVTAVRAAVVCEPDNHSERPQTGQECADASVRELLGMDSGKKTLASIESVSVSLAGASSTGSAPVVATVTVQYRCDVPLVGWMVCGLAGPGGFASTSIVRKASLPNQGAFYDYD